MTHKKHHSRRHRNSTKYALIVAIISSFALSFLIPSTSGNAFVYNALTFIGILFAILVGFFITDLYTRYVYIRQNAAADSSNLSSFYYLASILADETGDKAWLERTKQRIKKYVHVFMPLPWENYSETEAVFNELGESLKEIQISTPKAVETYRTVLTVYSQHSTSREALVMFGRDKLSLGEWLTLGVLGSLLVSALFLTKGPDLASILFTGGIMSAVLILFILLKDLNNLNFGESAVSVEPYERVLENIGEDRYYSEKGKHTL
ncbi:MAG: hypothetical protein WAO28_02945 [Candidatus Microsaccharimonas sp.]